MDGDAIPSPLAINLDCVASESGYSTFVASSPQFPDLEVGPGLAGDVVVELLERIRRAREDEVQVEKPLPGEVVEAFLEAGYPVDLLERWDRLMRGPARRYRYSAREAMCALQSYERHGVPPFAASEFIAAWWWRWEPKDAGRLHAAGVSAGDVYDYYSWSATDRWHQWDFDVIEWALSGVPADRVLLYAGRCSVSEARRWENIAETYDIGYADLDAILKAGFGVNNFHTHHGPYAEAGLTMADAARALLALR